MMLLFAIYWLTWIHHLKRIGTCHEEAQDVSVWQWVLPLNGLASLLNKARRDKTNKPLRGYWFRNHFMSLWRKGLILTEYRQPNCRRRISCALWLTGHNILMEFGYLCCFSVYFSLLSAVPMISWLDQMQQNCSSSHLWLFSIHVYLCMYTDTFPWSPDILLYMWYTLPSSSFQAMNEWVKEQLNSSLTEPPTFWYQVQSGRQHRVSSPLEQHWQEQYYYVAGSTGGLTSESRSAPEFSVI